MSASDVVASFRRYTALITPLLRVPAIVPEAENAVSVQIERASAYANAVASGSADLDPVDRLLALGNSPRLGDITVVDRSGHHRPVHRPLLVYALLQTYNVLYETLPREQFGRWDESLRPWCDLLEASLADLDLSPSDGGGSPYLPAGKGSTVAEATWSALALYVAGKTLARDAWIDLASTTFGRLVSLQHPSGAFLHATGRDNPETAWYHELVTLHAAASYAVQSEDRSTAAAVQRNTAYHLNETQPDHATTQPWGLFGFMWNAETRPLADGLIHTAQTRAALDGVSLILLADAVQNLRRFGDADGLAAPAAV